MRMGATLALTAVLGGSLVLTACDLFKKDSSSSGGGTTYTTYTGAWKLYNTASAGSGSCYTTSSEQGPAAFTVNSGGNYSFNPDVGTTVSGSVNLSNGGISATITDSDCGNGSITGSCSSFTVCTCTFSQTGGTADGNSGAISGSCRLAR